MLPDFTYELFFNGVPWPAALLAAVLFVGAAFFYYRATVPPVSRRLRILLLSLRSLAFCLLFLFLAQPVINLVYYVSPKPGAAVLVDGSLSMNVEDNGVKRSAVLADIAAGLAHDQELNRAVRLDWYLFADGRQALAGLDSLACRGYATNIGDNLQWFGQRLLKDNLKALVVISDGASNSGRDPETAARNLGVPVHAVGIGDTTPVRDISIRSVMTNEIAYRNNAVPVKVTFTSNGFAGREITVMLRDGKRVLGEQKIKIGAGLQEQEAVFQLTPDQAGLQQYFARIPVYQGEKVSRNNTYSFFIQVLKDKIKVLLVGGAPGFDHAFLIRSLQGDRNIDLTVRTARSEGGFYQGLLPPPAAADTAGFDLFILQDVPAALLKTSDLQEIGRAVSEKGKGLWVLAGEYSYLKGGLEATPLGPALPAVTSARTKQLVSRPFQPVLTPAADGHPVTSLSPDPAENRTRWGQIPPLEKLVKTNGLAAGAEVLATHPTEKYSTSDYCPVMAAGKYGQGKVLQCLAYPIWPWRFLPVGVDAGLALYFDQFTGNAVRWLTTTEETKRFRLATDKRVYKAGETVRVKAQLYDPQYRPLDGAEIEAELKGPEFLRRLALGPAGEPGLYAADVPDLPAGSFRLAGTARLNEGTLGQDQASFFVDDYSLEFDDIRMQEDLLKRVAAASGGRYFSPDSIPDLARTLAGIPREKLRKQKQLELWNSIYLLAAFILLLAVEWTIRKRKGML